MKSAVQQLTENCCFVSFKYLCHKSVNIICLTVVEQDCFVDNVKSRKNQGLFILYNLYSICLLPGLSDFPLLLHLGDN